MVVKGRPKEAISCNSRYGGARFATPPHLRGRDDLVCCGFPPLSLHHASLHRASGPCGYKLISSYRPVEAPILSMDSEVTSNLCFALDDPWGGDDKHWGQQAQPAAVTPGGATHWLVALTLACGLAKGLSAAGATAGGARAHSQSLRAPKAPSQSDEVAL